MKQYWIEDAYLNEPFGWDYVSIGRVTSEEQLLDDGTNWTGSCDSYGFYCFDTLEEALAAVTVRPSSMLWNESLTNDDMKIIRQWVRENEVLWDQKNGFSEVKEYVTVLLDNEFQAECEILLTQDQNQSVQSSKENPVVKAVFDKENKDIQLYKYTENNVLLSIDEKEYYFEHLLKFTCDAMYKYCNLYTEQDMRNFFTNDIKNNCLRRMEEEYER